MIPHGKVDLSQMGPILAKASKQDIIEFVDKRCLACFIINELYKPYPKRCVWKLAPIHFGEWSDMAMGKKWFRVLAPRDHIKSFYFTIARTLWRLKYHDGIGVYIFSVNDRLASRMLAKIRHLLETSPYLKHLATGRGWARTKNKTHLTTSNGGEVIAQGFMSSVRGPHPSDILLDDVIDDKVSYSQDVNEKTIERFFSAILPMAEPDTIIGMVGTVQREDDLYHSLPADQWTLREYSAILNEENHEVLFPQKWPYDVLMKRKAALLAAGKGEQYWRKEYLNDPTAMKEQAYKREWFKFYNRHEPPEGLENYQGWDLSVGKKPNADYTVGLTIGVTRHRAVYIRDIFRARLGFADRLQTIRAHHDRWLPRLVGIENNAFADDTVQEIIRTANLPVVGITTTGNKFARLQAQAVLFQNGSVYLPAEGQDAEGRWILSPEVEEFIREAVNFPGAYDDQLDALDIAIATSRRAQGRYTEIDVTTTPQEKGYEKLSEAKQIERAIHEDIRRQLGLGMLR